MLYDVIIIGSGPAGLSAAIYAERAKLKTLVLEKAPMSGGQILNTYEVDNYPGIPGVGGFDLGSKFRALRDIGYEKGVVMEPFLLQGGEVARDCKVWRDLSGNADEKMLDRYIKESLTFLKHEFTF